MQGPFGDNHSAVLAHFYQDQEILLSKSEETNYGHFFSYFGTD